MAYHVATLASCKAKDVAYTSAMLSFSRSFGSCLSIAISGTIFRDFLCHFLAHLGQPTEIVSDATGFGFNLTAMSEVYEKQMIMGICAWVFKYIWTTTAGVSAFGFATSFLINEHTQNVGHVK